MRMRRWRKSIRGNSSDTQTLTIAKEYVLKVRRRRSRAWRRLHESNMLSSSCVKIVVHGRVHGITSEIGLRCISSEVGLRCCLLPLRVTLSPIVVIWCSVPYILIRVAMNIRLIASISSIKPVITVGSIMACAMTDLTLNSGTTPTTTTIATAISSSTASRLIVVLEIVVLRVVIAWIWVPSCPIGLRSNLGFCRRIRVHRIGGFWIWLRLSVCDKLSMCWIVRCMCIEILYALCSELWTVQSHNCKTL